MLFVKETEIISKTFLFDGFSHEEVASLLEEIYFEKINFSKGDIIFSPKSFRRALGIILSGRVIVKKGELTVSELAVGDLFGAAALFNNEATYVSTLTARTDGTVIFFTEETVRTLTEKNAGIGMNYIRYLSGRIRFLSGEVDMLSEVTPARRILRYLSGKAEEGGKVRISMTELASRLSIGRATLYRELTRLEEDGAVSRDGKDIIVLRSYEQIIPNEDKQCSD